MRPSQRGEQGSNAILVAFSIISVAGFAALAIDIGFLSSAHLQLQSVADVTAQAAAWHLNGTTEGVEAATAQAFDLAELNVVWGESVQLAQDEVEVGNWDFETQVFSLTNDLTLTNAVRVSPSLNAIPTFFAGLAFGQSVMSTSVVAIAVGEPNPRPAGAVECYIPLAVPACQFANNPNETIQDITFVLNPAGGDNTGWSMTGQNPNATDLQEQINNCNDSGEVSLEDSINFMNGLATPVFTALADRVSGSTTTWDASYWGELPPQMASSSVTNYGRTYEGPIILFDGGPEYCTGGGSWTGSAEIVGFAWGAVYDVRASGSASQKNIRMRLDLSTDRNIGTDGGGTIDTGISVPGGGTSYLVR